MKTTALTLLTLILGFQANAQTAIAHLNHGFDSAAKLVLERPFPFYESCEKMPAKVLGHDPITQQLRAVSVEISRPREGALNKRVLVVPPTGGVNVLDRDYARMLCARGIEAWVITEWEPGQVDHQYFVDIRSHDMMARKALAVVRQVVSQMKAPVGILGTSSGAIVASVALAVEPKLKSGVLIAGGAGLPEIIANSQGELMANLRAQRLAHYGWTKIAYQQALESAIALDVEAFADGFAGKRIGTIVALRDRTVPVQNQLRLEALTNARRLAAFDDDHVSAIITSFVTVSYRVVDFFERNL